MQPPRFIFLSGSVRDRLTGETARDRVIWTLVSPNNRQLGRGATAHLTYDECQAAVRRLRAGYPQAQPLVASEGGGGRWSWRLDLDGLPVATSSRSYLRIRECHYNLERFLVAVPTADVVDGVRAARAPRPAVAGVGEVRAGLR